MKIIKFVFPLAILNLIALILVTFGLPNIIPIHMDLTGVVNGFASRWYIPIFGIIPIFIIIIYILYSYLGDSDLNREVEDKIIFAVVILFMAISWTPVILTLYLTDVNLLNSYSLIFIEVISFICIILSVFFIFMSYYMEKIKPNHYFGIRTPWTLKNEVVWEKTHRLGSYTAMIAGFVLLVYTLATFISRNVFYSIIGLVLSVFLLSIVPIIYSYFEFKKNNDII